MADHQSGRVVRRSSVLDELAPTVRVAGLLEGFQVTVRLEVLGAARGQHVGSLRVLGGQEILAVEVPGGDSMRRRQQKGEAGHAAEFYVAEPVRAVLDGE